jgi:hypothetical protein
VVPPIRVRRHTVLLVIRPNDEEKPHMHRTTPPLSRRFATTRRLARIAALAGAAALGVSVLATPAHAVAPGRPDVAVSILAPRVADVGDLTTGAIVSVDNVGQQTALNPVLHITMTPGLYSRVLVGGPNGPGTCAQDATGVDCTLGSLEPGDDNFVTVAFQGLKAGTLVVNSAVDPVLGEVNFANNVSTVQTSIVGQATTTTATAPATVRLGQPFTLHVEVTPNLEYSPWPTGTATVTGVDGITAAPLAQKSPGGVTAVANVSLVATHRGVSAYAVSYSGSSVYAGSTAIVRVTVQ